MEIIMIAAMAKNRVIGRGNEIPWHIPGEQKMFQRLTWGHPLIMGRKTHESIGRALPGRRNIIITGNRRYSSPGCEIVNSLPESLNACEQEKKTFIIGGGQLYRQGIKFADTLVLSILAQNVDGDVFFPVFSESDFILHDSREITGPVAYHINTYRRINR